ncbi:MAG: hypothetical protein MUC55_03465 [Burkholderiales bacterium]|jgi:hypothetical protein|nr:hypothetical protein [Burkholderiales bacterium]
MKSPGGSRGTSRIALALAAGMFCAAAAGDLAAELYRWRDPQTGATHYSSVPPAWYRRGEGGPPVQVIIDGKAVDRPSDVATPPVQAPPPPRAPAGASTPPPAASPGVPIAVALVDASRMREFLLDAGGHVERTIGTAPAWSRAPAQTREVAIRAARTSFLPDKLVAAMAAALAAEVDAAQLRAYQDALRTPVAQRMAALERERMRLLSGPDGLGTPTIRQASPTRARLVEEVEAVSNASEIAAMTVATMQATALGAVPRATPVDIEFEFERTRVALARDLRPRIHAALVFVYEPATDEELREYLAFHRRPEVARVTPALARAYARALGGGFNEWFGLLARAPQPATAGGPATAR